MEKKINKYESPEVETIDIKTEGVICATSPSDCTSNVELGYGSGCPETGR